MGDAPGQLADGFQFLRLVQLRQGRGALADSFGDAALEGLV